jgi:hypothetical protein
MYLTPGWSPTDRVFVIYPLEQDAQFAVSLLNYALAGMGIQPVIWLEISETRGLYLDVNEFFVLGLDKGLQYARSGSRGLSPIIEAQATGLRNLLASLKEDKHE